MTSGLIDGNRFPEVMPISVRPEVQKCVDNLAEANIVSGMSVGPGGQLSKIYGYFLDLFHTATLDELHSSLNHQSFVVQCYAFCAIVEKVIFLAQLREDEGEGGMLREDAHKIIYTALLTNLDKTEKIDTIFGCCAGKQSVVNVLIMYAEPHLTAAQLRNIKEIRALMDKIEKP
jgi:hypothetical protein